MSDRSCTITPSEAVNAAAVLVAAMMGTVLVTVDVSAVDVATPAPGRSFRTGVGGTERALNVCTLACISRNQEETRMKMSVRRVIPFGTPSCRRLAARGRP